MRIASTGSFRAPLSSIKKLGIINSYCCLSLRAPLSFIRKLGIINSYCCLSFRVPLSFIRELGIINSYCCLSLRAPLSYIRELGIINSHCCLSFRALLSPIRELGIINSNFFNPIQDWPFWGCSRMLGAKRSPLPKICHTSYNDETWYSCTVPKEDSEIYTSRDTRREFCWHQHFFTGNQQLLLYQ